MKLLSYHYHLKIEMDEPVRDHRFTLRCTPVSDARQRILETEHYITPADFLSESRDSWGNPLIYGCCRGEHNCFEANVCGKAVAGLADCVPSAHPDRDLLFQYPTALTAAGSGLCSFVKKLHLSGDELDQADGIMQGIRQVLRYAPGITTVSTTAEEAFAAGYGVCQDFAHVMLALLRVRKIPCRYVVGMLMGEGKSHAWVEVLHQNCWFAFDPTNCCRVQDAHIKLSHGRDYLDCAINRGLFRGSAGQCTDISVIVSEIKSST